MERKWTPAQHAAMSTLGRTLLISAAAGSGKTATLTDRIIRRLTDPEHPADLSRLLIVTFTRAAAAELRERISKALSEAISRDPGNRHLQKQLIGLGNAHISTIDAFCWEPVKAHFAELGLPAATRIADDAELRPLAERVMGDLIDEFYLKYRTQSPADDRPFALLASNPFANLCDALTSSKNDEDLIPTFFDLYNRLLSFPEEIERLRTEAERLESQAGGDFLASDHGRILLEWIQDFCHSAIPTLDDACDRIREDEKATKVYLGAFTADLEFCRALSAANTYPAMYDLMQSYQNQRLGILKGATEEMKACKEARTDIVDTIKDLRKTYFSDDAAALSAQMTETALMCRVLYDFLSEYDRRILAEKRERGICDFTDNRRFLLRLLRKDDGAFATEFAARFDEVYIDEYQDVDEMQDEIFRLVGGDHRFMVGDIKQSIYGFRGADPSVFARYRRALPSLSSADADQKIPGEGGNSIFMSDNFRCDESVIRVTNAVCGHMFRACPDSVGYRDEDDLGFSKQKPTEDYRSPRVEVTVLRKPPKKKEEDLLTDADSPSVGIDGDELSGVHAEAMYVANQIADLLRNRVPLADGTPIKPSDIVILMRSRSALSAYMEALTALGIPTGSEELDAMEAGRDILHGSDMMYLVNLLRVLDNPDNDIPLSEVLRAPFPGLDLEEVLTVRRVGDREAQSHSLYAGLEEYIDLPDADSDLREKITAFLAWVEHYRGLTATHPADGLLRLLRRDKRCACRHTAAFLYLYESSRTCRTATFVSLYDFLRYFEKKLATTKNAATAEHGRDGGHVSIMTIHRSKGLEFPVCFVVRCGQAFSNASTTCDLIFEKRAGVAMKLYRRMEEAGEVRQYKTDTTLRAVAALSTRLSEREEEMRVLYVAMTRARERLYLVGMGSGQYTPFRAGDRFSALSCRQYLNWILAGLDAHPNLGDHVVLREIVTDEITPAPRFEYLQSTENPASGETAAHYRDILSTYTPPTPMETLLRQVPTKVPASRMQANMLDTCVFFDTNLEPDRDGKLPNADFENTFCDAQSVMAIRESLRLMASSGADEFELLLGENRRPTAAEKGTAVHLFLQYCDYTRVQAEGLEAEIARLGNCGFLNERTVRILDRNALQRFFGSAFFAHLSEAVELRRELRFNRFVPLRSLTADPAFSEALGDRTLYVQGSIDILARFSDGHIELCDYKTDRITREEQADPSLLAAHMAEKHGSQLAQYTAAVEEMYGARPTKVYIYSLPLGEAVEIGSSGGMII